MAIPNKTVWNYRHQKHVEEIEKKFCKDKQEAEAYAEQQKAAGFNARVYGYNLGPKRKPSRYFYVKVWTKRGQP